MPRLHSWLARLAGTFSRHEDSADVRAEMEAHVELETAELIRRGRDPAAARREALLHAGGITQATEAVHDRRVLPWLEHLGADLRYAARSLRRAPGFALVVMVTLALSIGANTAIFSVVRGVLLKPLPHQDGDRLVYLRQSRDGPGGSSLGFSVPEVRDLREGSRSLDQLAELSDWTVSLQRPDGTERVDAGLVTGNWFEVMGLRPILGRVTGPENDGPGVPAVAVLTHDGWLRRFGGDSAIVGREIRVDGKSVTVIGVLQPAPFYPGRAEALFNMVVSEHHLSATMVEGRTHRMTEVIARLKPGASVAQARREVSDLSARLQQTYPDVYPAAAHYRVDVIPFKAAMGERAELTLWLLMAAAAFVLIIAVANVANLTLMRGVRREHELTIRASLGAGVARLRRLLLAENLLLTLTGAALGTVVAVGGTRLLATLAARFSPRAAEVRLDVPTFGYALAVSVGVALLLSLLAVLPREGSFAAWLLSGGHRVGGRGRHRVQRALVVVQVAVSVVLLAGAGLLTRTMVRLANVETGLRSEEVLSLSVSLLTPAELLSGLQADIGAKVRYEQMRSEAAALPGVIDAAVGSPGPLRASSVRFEVKAEGAPAAASGTLPQAELRTAGPGFFRTAGVPVVKGRGFEATDRFGAAPVVILNQALAEQLFPGQDPLGRRVAWTGDVLRFTPISGEWRTVVGVVANTQDGGLDAPLRPVMFMPFAQMLALGGSLVIRSERDVASLIPAVTRIVRRIAPTAPIENVLTIAQIRDQSVAPRRFNAALISLFGALAVLIAAVGIAGVLAFSVSARTTEIGIRMSLGADARRVLRMVLREGGVLVGLGLAAGVLGAYFATGLIRGLLFGVAPRDPVTLVGVAAAMTAIGLAACWIPAARAARIDPAITMRSS